MAISTAIIISVPTDSSLAQNRYFLLLNIQKYGGCPMVTKTKHHTPKKIHKINVCSRQDMLTHTHTQIPQLCLLNCSIIHTLLQLCIQSRLLYLYACVLWTQLSFPLFLHVKSTNTFLVFILGFESSKLGSLPNKTFHYLFI